MFTKLGRDEKLMAHTCYGVSARSAQGRAKIDHGGPLLKKNFFFRPEDYSNKPNVLNQHVGWIVVIFGSIPKSNVWRVHCTQVSDSGPLVLLFSYFCTWYINPIRICTNDLNKSNVFHDLKWKKKNKWKEIKINVDK